jgi:hypothetical protein
MAYWWLFGKKMGAYFQITAYYQSKNLVKDNNLITAYTSNQKQGEHNYSL